MLLKNILTEDAIFPKLKAGTRQDVVEEMVSALCAAGKINRPDDAVKAVMAREEKMATGLNNGVAIPHGTTSEIDQLIVAVGIHPAGVDFSAADGTRAKIIVLTLFPGSRIGSHIQFLAEIGKVLGRAGLRDRLLKASSTQEIFKILTD